jgi:hypothetical protein
MLKTKQVLVTLQTNYTRLQAAWKSGRIRSPTHRDASGDFLWTDEEVEAARSALATDRRYKQYKQNRQEVGT